MDVVHVLPCLACRVTRRIALLDLLSSRNNDADLAPVVGGRFLALLLNPPWETGFTPSQLVRLFSSPPLSSHLESSLSLVFL